jgi:hypothetical protein
MAMSSSNPAFDRGSGAVDWSTYQGYELATADRVRLGIVSEVVADDYTGEPILHVVKPADRSHILRVPARLIGVITNRRLMLDVTEENLGRLRLEVVPVSS